MEAENKSTNSGTTDKVANNACPSVRRVGRRNLCIMEAGGYWFIYCLRSRLNRKILLSQDAFRAPNDVYDWISL